MVEPGRFARDGSNNLAERDTSVSPFRGSVVDCGGSSYSGESLRGRGVKRTERSDGPADRAAAQSTSQSTLSQCLSKSARGGEKVLRDSPPTTVSSFPFRFSDSVR